MRVAINFSLDLFDLVRDAHNELNLIPALSQANLAFQIVVLRLQLLGLFVKSLRLSFGDLSRIAQFFPLEFQLFALEKESCE